MTSQEGTALVAFTVVSVQLNTVHYHHFKLLLQPVLEEHACHGILL